MVKYNFYKRQTSIYFEHNCSSRQVKVAVKISAITVGEKYVYIALSFTFIL